MHRISRTGCIDRSRYTEARSVQFSWICAKIKGIYYIVLKIVSLEILSKQRTGLRTHACTLWKVQCGYDSGGYPWHRKCGSKFTLVGRTWSTYPNQPRLIERLHYCVLAWEVILSLPVGLLTNRETRNDSPLYSTTWENRRDEPRFCGSTLFGNLQYAWLAMRVARTYTLYRFDGLIDRPIAPYLFIFHRVLAPGTISSFSFRCVRTRGGKKYEILTPTLFLRAWHSINFFFFVAPPKSLPKLIDCHISRARKYEAMNVPGLWTLRETLESKK